MEINTKCIEVMLGGAEILRGIDLSAHSGQFVGIIGPNGSGKSTLLKCIYRALKPTRGAVMLNQQSLSDLSYKQSAQKVAVVAQHNNIVFDFSVIDIVLLGRSPYKRALDRDTAEDYALARKALSMVDMEGFEDRSFATLSGGEQQRVILAQALTQQTPCILLDEPTNHLDIKYQLQMMDAVKGLDKTILAAIHDLNIAALYCDYIYVLKDGKIVAKGPTEEALTPELILSVYGVLVQIIKSDEGYHHILYSPHAWEEGNPSSPGSTASSA